MRGPPPSATYVGRLRKRVNCQAGPQWEPPGAGVGERLDPGGLFVRGATGPGGGRSPAGPPAAHPREVRGTDGGCRAERPCHADASPAPRAEESASRPGLAGPEWLQKAAPATGWPRDGAACGSPRPEGRAAQAGKHSDTARFSSYVNGNKMLNFLFHVFTSMWKDLYTLHAKLFQIFHIVLKY